jgi:hypothetical protein
MVRKERLLLCYISFFCKMLSSELHLYISLAYALVSLYFWFMTGKSSWVHSRTHSLFPLCCRWHALSGLLQVLSPPDGWQGLYHGHYLLCYLILMLLLVVTMELACIWTKCVWDGLNYLLPLLSNMVYNNLCDSDVCELLVKCCNMWYVMLNHVRSWLIVGWFEILHDFVGLPELYGLKYDNLITSVIVFVLVLL